jgi:Domain of unknown function (DUF955).
MVYQITNHHQLQVRITKPQSRANLRNLAKEIRSTLGINEDQLFVDVIACLELFIPRIDLNFRFSILEYDKYNMPNEAFYSPKNNCIYIRSDVYEKALDEDGRARFTIAHEIAHYFLFSKLGIPQFVNWSKICKYTDQKLHSLDPEWQADVVGNYLLCEADCIKNLSEDDIVLYCRVSKDAANAALRNAHGQRYDKNSLYCLIPSKNTYVQKGGYSY